MAKAEELHVAVARECNSATTDPNNATHSATPMQQGTLKCLANKVLERNNKCNIDATIVQNECNKLPLKDAEKLHTNSKPERWHPELVTEGYQWCFDCKYWDGQFCKSKDNPYATVDKSPQTPRKCIWYRAR